MILLCVNPISQRSIRIDPFPPHCHDLVKVKREVQWDMTFFDGLMGEADLLKAGEGSSFIRMYSIDLPLNCPPW